jgi:CBS domain-containing protein
MTLRARDVMEPHVVTVTPDTTLAELADLLIEKRISGVPVVQHDSVVGLVSRSDFARVVSLDRSLAGLIAAGDWQQEFAPGEVPEPTRWPEQFASALAGRTVREAMAAAPVTVSPDTPIDEVARALVTHHLHRVLVVEGRTLRGVISALDIVRLVATRRLAAP